MTRIFLLLLITTNLIYAVPPVCNDTYICEDISGLTKLNFSNTTPSEEILDSVLKSINNNILSSTIDTNKNSKQLTDKIKDFIKLTNKLYAIIKNKNLNINQKKITKLLKNNKADAQDILDDINKIKNSLLDNHKLAIESYIDIKFILNDKRKSYKSKKRNTDLQSCSNAGDVCDKTYIILESYNNLYFELEKIKNKLKDNIEYLKSLDDAILLHIENKCSKRTKKCIYPIESFDSDIGGLETLKSEYQKVLQILVTNASQFRQ